MFPVKRNLVFSLILFAVVTVTISVLIELAFRYIEYQQQLTKHRAVFRPNPYGTGSYRLKANLDFVSEVEGVTVRVTTNSLGMTGPEVLQDTGPDMRRIAFVGDSFTFGSWATDYTHSFVGVLQNLLGADTFEILNFGVGGYALDDIELMVREVVLRFSPDIVVVAIFNGNDFSGSHLGVNKHDIEDGTAKLKPNVLAERIPKQYWPSWLEEELINHETRQSAQFGMLDHTKAFFRQYTATWRVLSTWKDQWLRGDESDSSQLFLEEMPQHHNSFLSYSFWVQKNYPPVATEAIDVSLETLERIRQLLNARKIQMVIASIPMREQVYVTNPVTPNYDIRFPQSHVEKYAKRQQVAYCDLLPGLREYAFSMKRPIYFRQDPHFNDEGHSLAANLIADCLTTLKVIPDQTKLLDARFPEGTSPNTGIH